MRAGEIESDTIAATILPAGHPEDYIEVFANIYRGFVCTVRRGLLKDHVNCSVSDYPEINEGVAGKDFIEAALQGTEAKKWLKFKSAEKLFKVGFFPIKNRGLSYRCIN